MSANLTMTDLPAPLADRINTEGGWPLRERYAAGKRYPR